MTTKHPKPSLLVSGTANEVPEISTAAEFLDVQEGPAVTLSPLVKRVTAMARKAREATGGAQDGGQQADMRQLDLFVANLLDYNLKDDTATMEAPLFSLSTKPDMDTWKWVSADKKKWLEVTPSSLGRATIHDKDLLIYLTSQLVAAMNEAARTSTKMPGRRIRFTLHDFLIATGRDTGGKAYAGVEDMIDRLSGTRLKTNIEMGNLDRRTSFGLIERADYIIETAADGSKRMTSIEITLSEWLYRALEQKNVLTITPLYFELRKPLEKRLYELARKHVGDQKKWSIKEDNLLEKTGSKANIREFRRMLRAIINDDSIPDFRMVLRANGKEETMVHFEQKNGNKVPKIEAEKRKPKKATETEQKPSNGPDLLN